MSQQEQQVPVQPRTEELDLIRTKKKSNQPFKERFYAFALKYMQKPSNIFASRIPKIDEDIQRSNLLISGDTLVAVTLLITFICAGAFAAGAVVAFYYQVYILAAILPFLTLVPLGLGLSMPKLSAASRSAAIENELAYVIGYITVLADGGISPFSTIKKLASSGSIFPAIAKEAGRIMKDIEILGLDPISALEKESQFCPNRKFGDFLGGYISVLKSGGSVQSYLDSKLKDIFAYRQIKIKSSSELIGTLAESYIIATVVVGISLFILYLTQNLLNTGVQTIDPTMIILFSGVFVPGISIAFIFLTDSEQVKEPLTFYRPYYAFFIALPFGVLFYFLPVPIPVYVKLGIALLIMTTPAMILSMIHSRQKRAVEAKLPNFLRDISEIRKTGLAPERTIEQVAGRNYGGLSQHVKKISTQLSWGVPLRGVLESFALAVKSWVTRTAAFLLLEVIDVGGGSSKMFVSLAEFTEKNAQLDKERKSMVKPYVIIPYIGAVLVVVTTALMAYLLSAPGLNVNAQEAAAFMAPPNVIAQTTNLLLAASIFQAWFMGIVAGKLGESTMADGFKHAVFLVVISIISIYVAQLFIHL